MIRDERPTRKAKKLKILSFHNLIRLGLLMFVKQLDLYIFLDYFLNKKMFYSYFFYDKATVVGPVVLQNLIFQVVDSGPLNPKQPTNQLRPHLWSKLLLAVYKAAALGSVP